MSVYILLTVSQLANMCDCPPAATSHDATSSYFRETDGTPACQWLLTDDRQVTCPYQTMQYFKEVADSTKLWLLTLQKNQVGVITRIHVV